MLFTGGNWWRSQNIIMFRLPNGTVAFVLPFPTQTYPGVSMLLTTVLLMYIYTACWLNNYVVQLCPFWCNSYGARLSRLLTLTEQHILSWGPTWEEARPVAFDSMQLNDAQKRYCDWSWARELLHPISASASASVTGESNRFWAPPHSSLNSCNRHFFFAFSSSPLWVCTVNRAIEWWDTLKAENPLLMAMTEGQQQYKHGTIHLLLWFSLICLLLHTFVLWYAPHSVIHLMW